MGRSIRRTTRRPDLQSAVNSLQFRVAVNIRQLSRQAAVQMQMHAMSTEDSKALLHKLNNQLGVILAHAELLETKAQDASQKARASQVVNAALQAMALSRELRERFPQK